MRNLPCARCGSEEVIKNVQIVDRGEDNRSYSLELQICLSPHGILRKDAMKTAPTAEVCSNCGHVNLTVDRDGIKDLEDASVVRRATGANDVLSHHPRYKQFLKENRQWKGMDNHDQVRAFANWLREKRTVTEEPI